MFSLNQKILRLSYLEKIGGTGRTYGRTDLLGAMLNAAPLGWAA